jgi:hypothetical protein
MIKKRRNVQKILELPIAEKKLENVDTMKSDFINLHENIPLNTGLVQTHQSPVESARMPALYTYFKLCGSFQSTAAKLKIVTHVWTCAHFLHVRTIWNIRAHISILKTYQYHQ